jgi:hypothetical protein
VIVTNHFGIFSGEPIELCMFVCEKWRCGGALAICDSGRGELWSRRVAGRSIRIADVMGVRRVRGLNAMSAYVIEASRSRSHHSGIVPRL